MATSAMNAAAECTGQSCYFFSLERQQNLYLRGWVISSDTDFWLSLGGLVVLALLYEMVKSFRACLIIESQHSAANQERKPILLRHNPDPPVDGGMDCLQHFLCALFYLLEWTLLFLIFLAVIGFNVWNLIAVLVGLFTGYLVFGKGRVN